MATRTLTSDAPPRAGGPPEVTRHEDYTLGRFAAMASPCEVLIDTDDPDEAERAIRIAADEAWRIETKFSRYRSGNVVDRINHADGAPIAVDEETALLLDYAATCTEVSEGRFDITSGALRRVWTFDGGSRIPSDGEIAAVLRHVGWHRVTWKDRVLTMPAGMEIDLGGIGKEYAVDRASTLIAASTDRPHLINFGGDLVASGPRRGGRPWLVGVDDPDRTGAAALYRVELMQGGLATTGDARRFVMWRGVRLGHILNPRTGWPVESPPRAITVLARTCLEAGTLSTLAYLRGPDAQAFLRDQGVEFRIVS
ncbi:MAG: FAD:protein FMN transferase [Hyphomicrobiales bacterium]